MKRIILSLAVVASLLSCKTDKKNDSETDQPMAEDTSEQMDNSSDMSKTTMVAEGLELTPIEHATMVLDWDGTIMYIDPVGGAAAFEGQPKPNVILITDIHGDHLNAETIAAVYTPDTKIIAPKAVKEKMPADWQDKVEVLDNDQDTNIGEFNIKGIPMYNLREEAKKFHVKGRGNGYVIEHNDQRVYISGDTEDIPEMRNLKNIDVAFICMNLPYTMTEESAADAVLAFKPGVVYPYHYRGTDGLSDVAKFKTLVNEGNSDIEVVQLDWYPKQ